MELLSRRPLILLVFMSLLIAATKGDCVDLCYSHLLESKAHCDICYYECSETT